MGYPSSLGWISSNWKVWNLCWWNLNYEWFAGEIYIVPMFLGEVAGEILVKSQCIQLSSFLSTCFPNCCSMVSNFYCLHSRKYLQNSLANSQIQCFSVQNLAISHFPNIFRVPNPQPDPGSVRPPSRPRSVRSRPRPTPSRPQIRRAQPDRGWASWTTRIRWPRISWRSWTQETFQTLGMRFCLEMEGNWMKIMKLEDLFFWGNLGFGVVPDTWNDGCSYFLENLGQFGHTHTHIYIHTHIIFRYIYI